MTCRVLHVIPSLRWGTAERQLKLVVDHCDRNAFQHQICTLYDPSPGVFESHAVDLSSLNAARRWDLNSHRRLRERIRDFRPHIVHAWRHAACRAVSMASLGTNCRWIASSFPHSGDGRDSPQQLVDGLAVCTCQLHVLPRWSACPAGRSTTNKKIVQVDYGVLACVDAGRRREAAQWLRQRLSIPHNAKVVGFLGSFIRENHLQDAIWAADLMKFVRDNVHVVLAGYGPHEGRLRAYRAQVRIADRVHFITQPASFGRVLEGLDVCWAPGRTESTIGSLCEAMALGIPVVAAEHPSYRPYVENRQTGLLFRLGHRAGLARTTLEMLDHPQLAGRMADEACQRMVREFSAERIAECYRGLYCRMHPS